MKSILIVFFSCLLVTTVSGQNLVANNNVYVSSTLVTATRKILPKDNVAETKYISATQAYIKHAEAQLKLKKYNRALLDYIAAIDLDPNNLDAIFNRGALKIIMGDYAGAASDMTRIIMENPKDTDAYYNRATAKMNLDDVKGAIQDFSIVIDLNPEYTEAYYFRGLLKFELQDTQGACADWQQVAKYDSRAAKLLKKYRN